jgi:hypothetical protein
MNFRANPPRHREIAAGCVLAVIVAHLLLAQLTLVLAVVFVIVGRLTRWRLSWLLVPAAAGLAWIGAGGPGPAFAGFTAGPASVLRYLGGGDLTGRAGHPLAGLSSGLPGQFPVALLAGAAEAALAGWLARRRTGDRPGPAPRPGAVAAVRRALTAGWISAGAVLTRDGCALGVVPSTGAVAELRWTELAGGLLVTGAAPRAATVTSLQVVHAALRRRKPLIVLAPGDDASLTGALRAACAATGVPLQAGGELASPDAEASASRLWGRGKTGDQPAGTAPAPADLGRVVRERAAVLVAAGSPELAARACRDSTGTGSCGYRTATGSPVTPSPRCSPTVPRRACPCWSPRPRPTWPRTWPAGSARSSPSASPTRPWPACWPPGPAPG